MTVSGDICILSTQFWSSCRSPGMNPGINGLLGMTVDSFDMAEVLQSFVLNSVDNVFFCSRVFLDFRISDTVSSGDFHNYPRLRHRIKNM